MGKSVSRGAVSSMDLIVAMATWLMWQLLVDVAACRRDDGLVSCDQLTATRSSDSPSQTHTIRIGLLRFTSAFQAMVG